MSVTPTIVPVSCAVLLSGRCRTCQLWNLLVHLSTCCLLLFLVSLVVFSCGLCWVLTEVGYLSNYGSLPSLLSKEAWLYGLSSTLYGLFSFFQMSWSSPCIIRADVAESPASMYGGCSTDRRRQNCAFQRSSWSTGLVSVPPSSPRTGLSELDLLPDSFLVISYRFLVSFLIAASSFISILTRP